MICPKCHKEIHGESNTNIDVFLKDKDRNYSEFGGSMIKCENCSFMFLFVPFPDLQEETHDFFINKFIKRNI